MKKIDKLVLLDFIPPYLMAFFVAEFVLVMQFLWKYIDEIIGKGFSLGVLLEMIFYFSVRIIPEAVPVSILIASVMVFGNLAEKYEISAMKSSGISLIRIMWMGILISIFTACFSLLASNYLKPRANYKFIYRFNSIRKQKPALNIAEGTFSRDFRNFVIYVGAKGRDDRTGEIRDVLVYDHTIPDRRKVNMLVARKGRMYASDNDDYFIMELEDGEQYREIDRANRAIDDNSDPFMRTEFRKWTKVFDMSEFDLEASDLNLQRKEYDLLNAKQLRESIDSIDSDLRKNRKKFSYNYSGVLSQEEDTLSGGNEPEVDENLPDQLKEAIKKSGAQQDYISKSKNLSYMDFERSEEQDIAGFSSLLESFSTKDRKYLAKAAKYSAEKRQDRLSTAFREEQSIAYSRARYILRLHQQYSWALICIIFLFIGAPLGSIVKRGGYGYPLLVAIIFFMLFIILNIMGERLSKTMSIDPVLAAWLPNIVIAPLAVFLSYRAMNDKNFQDIRDFFIRLFYRIGILKS